MAEVAPLLTPQGWQLVTPVAASGAATGGAVGGVAGLALAAAGAGILALAFLMARRAAQKAAAKGKTPAGKQSSGAAGKQSPMSGLLSRLPRPGGKSASTGAAGGSRTGGVPSRGRVRGGGVSGWGRSGAGPGGARKGTGRLAGLRSKLGGKKPASSGAAGGKAGTPPGRPKGNGPGLRQRARNIGRARQLGAARERVLGKPGRPEGAGAKRSPGSARRGLDYLMRGRKTSSAAAKPATGPNGGKVGAAGEPRGKGIRVPFGGIGRASSKSRPGSFSPQTKRDRMRAREEAAGRDTTSPGRRGTSAVARRAIDNATSTPVGKRRRTMGDNTMPILHRPTINKTGLARTSAARLGSTPTSGPSPFAPVIEACAVAAQSYSPENALRAIAWYEGMPELIEALAAMFAAHARKNQEEFYLYPAAAEIANALGVKFAAYKGPCEDARAAFEGAHAEDLTKIRDPKANQEKWDIVANR